ARDPSLESRANAVGKVGGDKPVGSFALRCHGAALGVGDRLRDLIELLHLCVSQAVIAETKRPHQRAMDDEIGVAADRRGEVRVAAQIEAEMAEIVVAILGLRLASQHYLT